MFERSLACLTVTAFSLGASMTNAHAQVVEPKNFSAERFVLSLDRHGMLNVEWADIPRHLAFDLSLWLGIADDPLTVYRTDANGDTRVGSLVATRIGGGIAVALGLYEWVQIGVNVPLSLYQTRDATLPGFSGTLTSLAGGLGSPRVSPKIRIVSLKQFGVAVAFVPAFTIPTSQRDNYFGQGSLIFEPSVLVARKAGALRVAANLGARVRRTSTFEDLVVDDEIFGRFGAGHRLADLAGPPVELEAAFAVALAADRPFKASNQSYLEVLGGASVDLFGPFLAFAGAGAGLSRGFGAPDWRVLGGVRISDHDREPEHPLLLDSDGDGILDPADGAPFEPEDADGFEDPDGVPDHDNDGDGVRDWDDTCPNTPGVVENGGCPDSDADADGLVDRLDLCPTEAEDRDDFEDEDGCLDPDDDGDGVLDGADRCRTVVGRADNDGCPDADTDGDGVVDRLDNCPTEAGTAEHQGCTKKQLVTIGKTKLEILQKVYFGSGSDRIQARSFALLDNVTAVLLSHTEITKIVVEGHTDDRGSQDSNKRLSQRRAASVVRYLVQRGIGAERLEAIGYGEELPVASNQTNEGRADNRRVEFVIADR